MSPSPIAESSTTAATSSTSANPSAAPSPRQPPVPLNGEPSNSVASTPRHSLSQIDFHSDLRELRAKAKRLARWNREHRPGPADGKTGSAETAVVVDPEEVVKQALRNFNTPFSLLSPEWATALNANSLPSLSLEELRSRIESNLDRMGSFPHGQDGTTVKAAVGAPVKTQKHIDTLQKLDVWLHSSEHPMSSEVLYWLWRGVGFLFDYLASSETPIVDVAGSVLEAFCRALQELSIVLPSSLYHVRSKEMLLDPQVEAATGLIYADILELVGSVVQDVILPAQPTSGSSSTGGIRQALMGKAREHHHSHSISNVGISLNTNVPPATASAPTSPTSPVGGKKQSSLLSWKMHIRTALEQVSYHSKLLQSKLSHLQAKEQTGRFGKISAFFDDAEEAETIEQECRRELEELAGNNNPEAVLRRGSESSSSSGGLPLDGLRLDGGSLSVEGMQGRKAELVQQCRAARQAKKQAYARALEEAGHIKCDVCTYTAFEASGVEEHEQEDDHLVHFSANLREFSDSFGGAAKSEKAGKDSEEATAPPRRRNLFRLYITNENTVEALGNINPRFLLNSRGKKALDDGPNLWSFARAAKSTPNWRFIKTTLPNLEKGYGSEARRYAIEAREETAYFYDTTWKIYWCQPRPHEVNACPVAILVLAGDDVPLGRPIDPSQKAQRDFQRARHELVQYYRRIFHVPLTERGTIVLAENLAVQILAETKRRWREVLDQMRNFIDILTDLLYVQASNSSMGSTMGAVEQRKAAEALASYNHAAGQVFKILIKVNSYESMFIETMSYINQLADVHMGLGASKSDLLQLHDDFADIAPDEPYPPHSRSNTRSLSRSGLLRMQQHAHAHPVSWREIARGHQDLLDSLKSTKRQADSLKTLIDHQHSMYESRVSNQHSMIANFHAAEATRQADEAAAQNASMRRLTVVTFIFLPLTFVAGLFGTNVEELGQGGVPMWVFFAVGVPFAGLVLAAWWWAEFQAARTGGAAAVEGGGGRSRVAELEMEMQRLSGLVEIERERDGRGGTGAGGRGYWEGGDRMV